MGIREEVRREIGSNFIGEGAEKGRRKKKRRRRENIGRGASWMEGSEW